ncbi:MAG: butyrate kinase [Bacilli bacterium]|nr:butyrate kinase [Bacilli bacterium]
MPKKILVINLGSSSSKVSVYEDEKELMYQGINHSQEEINACNSVFEEYPFRKQAILDCLEKRGFILKEFDAICGRGGMLRSLESGIYRINEKMVLELKEAKYGEHASNLSAILAFDFAFEIRKPAFIVDPVSVDEMEEIARISGMPLIERRSFFHALNQKAIARQAAKDKGCSYQDLNLIVVHLGSGISVGVHKKGRVVDVNDSREGDGPMAPERSGSVPIGQLYRLCFSGNYTLSEIIKMNHGQGGLYAYLGTKDALEVVRRINQGDKQAKLIYEAMIYQIAKEIGAAATVLNGNVDAIILTGGLAYENYLTENLVKRISFLGDVQIYPGENEMLSLAQGALRALNGLENIKDY